MGTIKDFIYGGMSEGEKQLPMFIVVKVPQFWEYATGKQNAWKYVDQNERSQKVPNNPGQQSQKGALLYNRSNVRWNRGNVNS